MKNVLIASGLVLLLAGGASAQTSGSTRAQPKGQAQTRPPATMPFLTSANRAGQMEIAVASMAQRQAKNPRVKAYAQMLESDHRQANQQLDVMASLKGVTLAADQGMSPLDAVARLQNLKGHAFDVAYIDQMIEDHVQAIKDFQQAAAGTDADVGAFASKMLPTLQKHLQEAREIKTLL